MAASAPRVVEMFQDPVVISRTIAERVEDAEIIARVTVADVEAARWNTMDGELPAGGFDPEAAASLVHTPAALTVDHFYKTPDPRIIGLTVAELGGERDGYDIRIGEPYGFAVDQTGIVFMQTPVSPETPPMFDYLSQRAIERSTAYGPFGWGNAIDWYRFKDGEAIGMLYGDTMPQQDLIDAIEAALP